MVAHGRVVNDETLPRQAFIGDGRAAVKKRRMPQEHLAAPRQKKTRLQSASHAAPAGFRIQKKATAWPQPAHRGSALRSDAQRMEIQPLRELKARVEIMDAIARPSL